MKTISVYDLILRLRKAGLWNAVAGSCQYWATRADYATIYEWIRTHEPARTYGYRVRACKALSHKILGGGGKNTASTPKSSNMRSQKWSDKSTSDPKNDNRHDDYRDYKDNQNLFELICDEPLGFLLFSFAVALVLSLVILIVGLL